MILSVRGAFHAFGFFMNNSFDILYNISRSSSSFGTHEGDAVHPAPLSFFHKLLDKHREFVLYYESIERASEYMGS